MSMGEVSTGVLSVLLAVLVFFAARKAVRNFSRGSCGCHDNEESGCGGCQGCSSRTEHSQR